MDPNIYKSILESLTTGIYLVDRDRKIKLWNDGAEKITGHLRHEVIGRCCYDDLLMHCDENGTILCGSDCPLKATIYDGKPREARVFLLHKNGERVPVLIKAVAIRDADGMIIGGAESFEERVLTAVAEHSPNPPMPVRIEQRPGVLDRAAVEFHLRDGLQELELRATPLGVLAVTVDGLSEFRDIHGAIAVETTMGVVARTVARSVRPGDWVGRWSEDLLIVTLTNHLAANVPRLADLLRRIVNRAAVPWWGDHLSISISIGAAWARPGDTVELLLERSQEAVGRSLAAGGNRVTLSERLTAEADN